MRDGFRPPPLHRTFAFLLCGLMVWSVLPQRIAGVCFEACCDVALSEAVVDRQSEDGCCSRKNQADDEAPKPNNHPCPLTTCCVFSLPSAISSQAQSLRETSAQAPIVLQDCQPLVVQEADERFLSQRQTDKLFSHGPPLQLVNCIFII